MYNYARIDENGFCVGVSQLSGAVDRADMVLLDDYDEGVLNKRYIGGVWEDSGVAAANVYEPTGAEVAQMITDLKVSLFLEGVIGNV